MQADVLNMLAIWELIHESADEGLKSAIARGVEHSSGDAQKDPGSFVDGLSALVDSRKEELKRELLVTMDGEKDAPSEGSSSVLSGADDGAKDAIADLRFEVAELRGAIETLTTQVDALQRSYERAHPPVTHRS